MKLSDMHVPIALNMSVDRRKLKEQLMNLKFEALSTFQEVIEEWLKLTGELYPDDPECINIHGRSYRDIERIMYRAEDWTAAHIKDVTETYERKNVMLRAELNGIPRPLTEGML